MSFIMKFKIPNEHPSLWTLNACEYVLELSKETLLVKFGQGVSNLKARKFWSQKKLRQFGFEATPFTTLFSESLLLGRPGFEFWLLQLLLTPKNRKIVKHFEAPSARLCYDIPTLEQGNVNKNETFLILLVFSLLLQQFFELFTLVFATAIIFFCL